MQGIIDFYERFILEFMQGEQILDLFNNYFENLSDANQVLLLIGVSILSVFGAILIVKWLIKLTSSVIKLIVIVALIYFLVFVVLGFDIANILG